MNSLSNSTCNQDALRFDAQSLILRCLGRAELAQRVLDRFHLTFASDLIALTSHCDNGNLREVARVAHRLKGGCLSVSAGRLAELSDRLEHHAESAADLVAPTNQDLVETALDGLQDLLDELSCEYQHVAELTSTTPMTGVPR